MRCGHRGAVTNIANMVKDNADDDGDDDDDDEDDDNGTGNGNDNNNANDICYIYYFFRGPYMHILQDNTIK